ncbi:hypothetical protein KDA_58290 [Dictyobacter alpinus]|uniref:GAF domain-containing protein n=1 Tax=Dictyobacter alpinus TaxID=2014873 RepID=A0A402BFZ9_9CHLR|nr:hypothetical protein KDA_57970 [Dictyobacter alpinus]GCE30345.1 hypothetical protein KDA_58290 [Dictyobacter alpinus]
MTKNKEVCPFLGIAIQKDLYKRVFELLANVEDENRQWQIAQAIFEYMLVHFDERKQGIAIRYAKVGPDHGDGVHSLYETSLYGTPPWPMNAQYPVYWGRTHLGGWAAELQRMQRWDTLDGQQYRPIDIDLYEQSSCAEPIMRGNYLAGVLMVSSTQPGFFKHPFSWQVVHDYALLLNLAFSQSDFYSLSCIKLRTMPALAWQRAEMEKVYVKRVLFASRHYNLTRQQAEGRVRGELELEFEQVARLQCVGQEIAHSGKRDVR